MTERQRPKLEIKRRNDYHKNGFLVHGVPPADDTEKIDEQKLEQLLNDIREAPMRHVRRGRRKHDRKRKPQRE